MDKHLFFDLDETLWDFERNSKEVVFDLFHELRLESEVSVNFEQFFEAYKLINHQLWAKLRSGAIDKSYLRKNRFHFTLLKFGLNNLEKGIWLDEQYLERTPHKKGLIPYSIPVLNVLSRRYHLHIITNGFDDVQHFKLANCGLSPFFKIVVTSDRAGTHKPDRAIFDFAMKSAGATPKNSIMIGDDPEVDIQGAMNAGMSAILYTGKSIYNEETMTSQVNCLSELLQIL
ncbi:MAG: YjjG family noncanonical pyrimidine nucleotidase [Flavobacteriales bacterium]